jgi:hypothetical protein
VLKPGETRAYTVAMVNDDDRPRAGKLCLVFTGADGKDAAQEDEQFSLAPLGAQSYTISLAAPQAPGEYTLRAVAAPEDDGSHPSISLRKVSIEEPAPQK